MTIVEEKYKSFFYKLEQIIRDEFRVSPFPGTRIINNYNLYKELNVSIELIVGNYIPIEIVCDIQFPKKRPPSVYCIGKYKSPIINP